MILVGACSPVFVSSCSSRTFGLGSIVERRERKALEDPVKNGACLRNVPAPTGSEKDEFDV